jgi:acyl carrier protein
VVAAGGGQCDGGLLRRAVAGVLPEYMVPAAVVVVDALPLSPNGKLDRRALPAPDYRAEAAGRAPASPREEILCQLFAEVLGVDRVGVEDSFFDLGGHSLLAAVLASRLTQLFGTRISLKSLMASPSVKGISEQLTPEPEIVVGTGRQ